jgi:hypothetical protein
MEENQTDKAPEKEQVIKITLVGDKISCHIEGTYDRLVNMIASLLVDEKAPLREIVDDAIRTVLAYELGKDNPEEILNAISESLPPKGAA